MRPVDDLGFAGRAKECALLAERLERAERDDTQLVLISGEPGIGKTRLTAEFATHAHRAGATVLYGRCDNQLAVPFQPFVETLDWYLDHAAAPDLGGYAADLARLTPRVDDTLGGGGTPLQADPNTEQYRLFEAVTSWLRAAARQRPVVLVVDDLHWATRPTVLMLRHIARTAGDVPIVIVATFRPSDIDLDDSLGDLMSDLGRASELRLALDGLDFDAVVDLVGARAAEHDNQRNTFAETLRVETGGNPFFMCEVLRLFRARATGDDGPVTASTELGIPEGVRDAVRQRLSLIGTPATECLRVASLVGASFDLDLLSAGLAQPAADVLTALETALSAGLIVETDVDTFAFAHALVQAVLSSDLSTTRRSHLHARLAAHLEATRPDDSATLAYHWCSAGSAAAPGNVAQRSHEAGTRAIASGAFEEAVSIAERALDVLHQDAPEATLPLRLLLGDAQRLVGDVSFRSTLLTAANDAHELGDAASLVHAALGLGRGSLANTGEIDQEMVAVLELALRMVGPEPSATRARLLARLAVELMYGSLDARLDLRRDESIRIVEDLGDPELLVDVVVNATDCTYDDLENRQRAQGDLDAVFDDVNPLAQWMVLARVAPPCSWRATCTRPKNGWTAWSRSSRLSHTRSVAGTTPFIGCAT